MISRNTSTVSIQGRMSISVFTPTFAKYIDVFEVRHRGNNSFLLMNFIFLAVTFCRGFL